MFENILLALESLRANKMRAFLTMLGIIIGISSVIGIMSIGNALTSFMTNQFTKQGAYNIYIWVQQRPSEDGIERNIGWEDKDMIHIAQLEKMKEELKDYIVDYELDEQLGSGKVKEGRVNANVSIRGVNEGYFHIEDKKLLQGRFLNEQDINGKRATCVVTDKTVKKMFGTKSPIGEKIRVYWDTTVFNLTIVGVIEDTSIGFGMGRAGSEDDRPSDLYLPVTRVKDFQWSQGFYQVKVQPKDPSMVNEATMKLNEFWEKAYRKNRDFIPVAENFQNQLDTAMQTMNVVSLVISIIAGISLLVGGIGVMNIMLVSVTERTHEIGIRKALGAQNGQIRLQFVTEAMILSAVGGIIGIILGLLLGNVGAGVVATSFGIDSITAYVSPVIVAGTVIFSMIIGVFFGLYPANKAAMLDPIDALRYE